MPRKYLRVDSRLMKLQQQLTRYIRRRRFTNLQDRKSVFAPFLQLLCTHAVRSVFVPSRHTRNLMGLSYSAVNCYYSCFP